MKIVAQFVLIAVFLSASSVCFPQNKLTRNQILNAVRTHQQNGDSIVVTAGDTVRCDSTTTKITLEVLNDSAMRYYSYKLTFTKDVIEVDVYNPESNLYRSTFEYDKSSFEKLKTKINKYNLKKVDSYDDIVQAKENSVLKLYRGNKVYMSVESYNGRTNVTNGFHGLVKEIKKLIPNIYSAITICESYELTTDSIPADSVLISLALSEESLKFKSKGGEFKKIKVTCSFDDWEVLECPEWITYSRNNNNEIIFESSKNETKTERKGVVKVGCLGEIKEIAVVQT